MVRAGRFLLAVGAVTLAFALCAEEVIKLPAPEKTGGMPLLEALAKRESNRRTSLNVSKPTLQQLSDVLWAANGVTRENGRRTAPSAMDRREVQIAALTQDGLFLYDPIANTLTPKAITVDLEDQRRASSIFLIYYYREGKQTHECALVDVGFVGQNVYLYCTSKGWATFFMGSIDRPKLAQALGCTEKEVLFGQRIGIR